MSDEKKRGKLIETYLFNTLRYENENDENYKVGQYRIKIYHMEDDEFRGNVYPVSWLDWMRYKWFNRKYFRIM